MAKLVDGYAKMLIDTYKALGRAELSASSLPHRKQLSKSKDEVLDTLVSYLEEREEKLNQEKKIRLCN